MIEQLELLPAVAVRGAPLEHANELLEAWGHPLGACRRPFGSQAWILEIDRPIALAISASIVSSTVEGYGRAEVVELARIARAPDEPAAMRPMLRIWREWLAPRWPYWTIKAAISYAMPGSSGDLYRFDGWSRIGARAPSRGGGTWSHRPAIAGVKTLWIWRY